MRRWGDVAAEAMAEAAAAAVGGYRNYYLRRSSLRLARGLSLHRRPASAKVLFEGEDEEQEDDDGDGDDTRPGGDDDDRNQTTTTTIFINFARGERSPLDLVQEKYQTDPWRVVVACMLIARTSGGVTPLKTIANFLAQLATPTAVVRASDAEVEALLQPLGLQRNRRASVKATSLAFLASAWKDPAEFKGCGGFCSDSWRVFCRGETQTVRGIEDAMLRSFVRWCSGGGGSGGGGGVDAVARRKEAADAEKKRGRKRGGGAGGEGRDGAAAKAAAAAAALAASGGRVTRARVAAAEKEMGSGGGGGAVGRELRAARRAGVRG